MAVSQTTVAYTGLGLTIGDTTLVNHALAFDVPDEPGVTLTVYDELDPLTPITASVQSVGVIEITQNGAMAASGNVIIKITVPLESFVRSLTGGNPFKSDTLSALFTQLMIAIGTVSEGRLSALVQDLDMGGNQIKNVADGTDAQDVVTKSQLDATEAGLNYLYAEEWANKAEDSLVSAAAGGDLVDDYSALHHANKASASAISASASAAAAAASAASGLYGNVVSKVFPDSPIAPAVGEEGTLYRVDTSGGNVVINLSALSTYGEDMKFAFVKETADANTVTINAGGSDTIAGSASIVLDTQYSVTVLVGDSATGKWTRATQTAGTAVADPKVCSLRMATSTSCPNVTFTKLNFDTVVYDPNSWADTANKRITPEEGWYIVTAEFKHGAVTTGANKCVVRKNGSNVYESDEDYAVSGNSEQKYRSSTQSFPIYMNGTDYFEIFFFHATGGTISANSSTTENQFTVTKL